jgi:hypothetical protein
VEAQKLNLLEMCAQTISHRSVDVSKNSLQHVQLNFGFRKLQTVACANARLIDVVVEGFASLVACTEPHLVILRTLQVAVDD